MGWPKPEQLRGDPEYIRVYAGTTKEEERECPLHRAIKARPNLRPVLQGQWYTEPFELFALAPVMTELDRQESIDEPGRRGYKTVHAGLARWADQAVRGYLRAATSLDPDGLLRPVKQPWIHQTIIERPPGREVYDLCAWGRRYESADGRVRELRLLKFGSLDDGDAREPGVVELAAYVVAMGRPAESVGFDQPYKTLPEGRPVEKVRVVEVGCTDGRARVLFDGTVAETVAPYQQEAAKRLRATVDATERIPCASCAKCPLASSCTALTRVSTVPGVLGVDQPRIRRRKVAMTDLRNHQRCATQQHLRELHLPRDRDVEYGPAEQRGQAVHEYIKQLHARPGGRPCAAEDAPPKLEWQVGKWRVSGEEAKLANELISRHVAVCPLRYADPGSELQPEPLITVYDRAAETIVLATPDLLYVDDGSIVWREVKTTRYLASRAGEDVLETYPQAALAVVLLATGGLAGNTSRSRVELEILRPTGPDLEIISPQQPERLAKAQQVVTELAAAWHGDTQLRANPGDLCRRCEVARWCPDRFQDAAITVTPGLPSAAS